MNISSILTVSSEPTQKRLIDAAFIMILPNMPFWKNESNRFKTDLMYEIAITKYKSTIHYSN